MAVNDNSGRLAGLSETHFGKGATKAIVRGLTSLADYDAAVLTKGAERLYRLYEPFIPMAENVYSGVGLAKVRREPRNGRICVFADTLEDGEEALDIADTLVRMGFKWIEVRGVFAPSVSPATRRAVRRRSETAARLAEDASREADLSPSTSEFYDMKAAQLPLLSGQPVRELCPAFFVPRESLAAIGSGEGTETVRQEISVPGEDGASQTVRVSYIWEPRDRVFMTATEPEGASGAWVQVQDWPLEPSALSLPDSFRDEVATGRGPMARAYNVAAARYFLLKGQAGKMLKEKGVADAVWDTDSERLWFADPSGRLGAAFEADPGIARRPAPDPAEVSGTLAALLAKALDRAAPDLAALSGDPAGQAEALYRAYMPLLKAVSRMRRSRREEGVPDGSLRIPARLLAYPLEGYLLSDAPSPRTAQVLKELPEQAAWTALSMLAVQGYARPELREHEVGGPSSYIEPERLLTNTYFYEIGEGE